MSLNNFFYRCMNGGTCIDGVDSFKCSCPTNSYGLLCECVTSTDGENCEILPEWFIEKEFFPITTEVTEIPYLTTLYFSEISSVKETIPSPTQVYDSLTSEFDESTPVSFLLSSSIVDYNYTTDIATDILTTKIIPITEAPFDASESLWRTPYELETFTSTLIHEPTLLTSFILDSLESFKPTPTIKETFVTTTLDLQTPHILWSSRFDSSIDILESLYFSTEIHSESLASEILYSTMDYIDLTTSLPILNITTFMPEDTTGLSDTTSSDLINATFVFKSTVTSEEPEISTPTDFVSPETATDIFVTKDDYLSSTTKEFTTTMFDYFTSLVTEISITNFTEISPVSVSTFPNVSDSDYFLNVTTTDIPTSEKYIKEDTTAVTAEKISFIFEVSNISTQSTNFTEAATITEDSTTVTSSPMFTTSYQETSLVSLDTTLVPSNFSEPMTEEKKTTTELPFFTNVTFITPFESTTENLSLTDYEKEFYFTTKELLIPTEDFSVFTKSKLSTQKITDDSTFPFLTTESFNFTYVPSHLTTDDSISTISTIFETTTTDSTTPDSTEELFTKTLSIKPTNYSKETTYDVTAFDYFNETSLSSMTTELTNSFFTEYKESTTKPTSIVISPTEDTKPFSLTPEVVIKNLTTEKMPTTIFGESVTVGSLTSITEEETTTPPSYMTTDLTFTTDKPRPFETLTTFLEGETTESTTYKVVITETPLTTDMENITTQFDINCLSLTCYNKGVCIVLQSGNTVVSKQQFLDTTF